MCFGALSITAGLENSESFTPVENVTRVCKLTLADGKVYIIFKVSDDRYVVKRDYAANNCGDAVKTAIAGLFNLTNRQKIQLAPRRNPGLWRNHKVTSGSRYSPADESDYGVDSADNQSAAEAARNFYSRVCDSGGSSDLSDLKALSKYDSAKSPKAGQTRFGAARFYSLTGSSKDRTPKNLRSSLIIITS